MFANCKIFTSYWQSISPSHRCRVFVILLILLLLLSLQLCHCLRSMLQDCARINASANMAGRVLVSRVMRHLTISERGVWGGTRPLSKHGLQNLKAASRNLQMPARATLEPRFGEREIYSPPCLCASCFLPMNLPSLLAACHAFKQPRCDLMSELASSRFTSLVLLVALL